MNANITTSFLKPWQISIFSKVSSAYGGFDPIPHQGFALDSTEGRWRGGATGKAFGLAINRSRVQILLELTLRNNLRQVVYPCASVTKQYNLVPAKGRWCSVAGEVTAGLAESNGSLPPGGW